MKVNLKNIFIFNFISILLFMFAVTVHGSENKGVIVEQEVVDALNDGDVAVIIILKEDTVSFRLEKSEKKRRIRLKQSRVLYGLTKSEFKVKRKYKTIYGMAGRVSQKGLKKLMNHPDILMIHKDRKAYINLVQSIPLINAEYVQDSGFTGAGETVSVIDTGVDYIHSSLGGCLGPGCKVLGGYDFVNDDSDPMDDNGHGTHVAGIVASTHSTYGGVAPGADIVALKVLDTFGGGNFSDVAAAVDWSIDNKDLYNISVINMSLGDGGEYNNPIAQCDRYLTARAISDARDAGIITMVASGNDAHSDGISYPACATDAVSVGGVYDADLGSVSWCANSSCSVILCTDNPTFADKVVCHTNSDEILDLMAPDYAIYSTALGGGFTTKGGTSMAAPHASGAAALLIADDNLLTPDEVEAILVNTGYEVTDPKNGLIFPRIDLLSALAIDTDEDGILDDGDGSRIVGDNTCTGGGTIDCDDNCIDIANPDQADADSDGVGDVCDDDCTLLPARILGAVPVYYSALQTAYDAAGDGETIQAQDELFIEDIFIDRDISVNLEGGYDCDYLNFTGKTIINGDIVISAGKIVIQDGTVEIQ